MSFCKWLIGFFVIITGLLQIKSIINFIDYQLDYSLVFRNTGNQFLENIQGFDIDHFNDTNDRYDFTLSIWNDNGLELLLSKTRLHSHYTKKIKFDFSRNMSTHYSIGQNQKLDFLLRDFAFWKIAVPFEEIVQIGQQVGDIKVQWQHLIRYYKLTLIEVGIYQYDYSPHEQHFRFRISKPDSSMYYFDDQMEKQIGFAMISSYLSPFDDITNFHIRTEKTDASTMVVQMMQNAMIQKHKQKLSNGLWQNIVVGYDKKKPIIRTAVDLDFIDNTSPINTGLVSYWRLNQDSYGDNYLIDDSRNPQYITLTKNLIFSVAEELYNNNPQLFSVSTKEINEDISIKLAYNNKNNQQTYISDYKFSKDSWVHLSVSHTIISAAQISTIQVCIMLFCFDSFELDISQISYTNNAKIGKSFKGSFRELRLWNTREKLFRDDYFHFFKRDIINPTQTPRLVEYWRLDSSEYGTVSAIYSTLDYISIQTSIQREKISPLQLCEYGSYYNGASCNFDNFIPFKDDILDRIKLLQMNLTAIPITYSFGFWFKFGSLGNRFIMSGKVPQISNFIALFVGPNPDNFLRIYHNNCEKTIFSNYLDDIGIN
ncbi:UNKNOWN [Stylonychia lemnae]|uniref:Uncharacterized protein n=1 Tax=Stylonychia lemnae TaxID=5949 RepID=A0A078A237_STYLE|nr:UNKNOWN [Stylonychia lemnae]|eukprot:CDW75882.1 UNKNOWN [Stylonychia lemnae]